MSQRDTRSDLLRELRGSLTELGAEGIDVIGRPAPRAHKVRGPASPASSQGLLSPPLDPAALTDRAEGLQIIRKDLGECTRCGLHVARQNIVFGEGNPEAPVVFVGEGPGAEEDRTGRPFVGRAGELLTKIIESVGWRREDVYICNIVKCRPPKNREPLLDEVATCRPYLEAQLMTIRPLVIVSLGKPASSTLLGRNIAITKTRGIWQEWNGIPLMPTFHPAYLLRNYTRETRQAVWDDLRAVRARVDEAGSR